jgi:hypothetical protein
MEGCKDTEKALQAWIGACKLPRNSQEEQEEVHRTLNASRE